MLSLNIFYYIGEHIVPTYIYLGELFKGVFEFGLSIASYTRISNWRSRVGDLELEVRYWGGLGEVTENAVDDVH